MIIDSPDAPWNQVDFPKKEVEVTICMSISKTVKVFVDDYKVYEDGLVTNFADCDLYKAVQDQIILPTDLAYLIESLYKDDIEAHKINTFRYSVEDCKDWNIDDMQVFLE